MKKIMSLILVFIIAIIMCSCSNSPEISDLESSTKQSQAESSSLSNEDEYIKFVGTWSGRFDDWFNKQNEVVQKMVKNPDLLTDKDWINELAFACVDVNTLCNSIINYDVALVPEEYLEGHDLLVKSTTDFREAMNLVLTGIKENDILNRINDSTKYIDSGAAYLSKATDFFAKVL